MADDIGITSLTRAIGNLIKPPRPWSPPDLEAPPPPPPSPSWGVPPPQERPAPSGMWARPGVMLGDDIFGQRQF